MRIYTARSSCTAQEKEAWELHNGGMEDYHGRKFTRAAACFGDVVKILPGDDAARLLMERSRAFEKTRRRTAGRR